MEAAKLKTIDAKMSETMIDTPATPTTGSVVESSVPVINRADKGITGTTKHTAGGLVKRRYHHLPAALNFTCLITTDGNTSGAVFLFKPHYAESFVKWWHTTPFYRYYCQQQGVLEIPADPANWATKENMNKWDNGPYVPGAKALTGRQVLVCTRCECIVPHNNHMDAVYHYHKKPSAMKPAPAKVSNTTTSTMATSNAATKSTNRTSTKTPLSSAQLEIRSGQPTNASNAATKGTDRTSTKTPLSSAQLEVRSGKPTNGTPAYTKAVAKTNASKVNKTSAPASTMAPAVAKTNASKVNKTSVPASTMAPAVAKTSGFALAAPGNFFSESQPSKEAEKKVEPEPKPANMKRTLPSMTSAEFTPAAYKSAGPVKKKSPTTTTKTSPKAAEEPVRGVAKAKRSRKRGYNDDVHEAFIEALEHDDAEEGTMLGIDREPKKRKFTKKDSEDGGDGLKEATNKKVEAASKEEKVELTKLEKIRIGQHKAREVAERLHRDIAQKRAENARMDTT